MAVATTRTSSSRDVRIDWLRGLAMTCVIVDHSQRHSVLSWFSYERFWLVSAAEVFVVLSGIVLGMVYGPRLGRDGWLTVVQRLVRRALTLYGLFIAVTLSVLAIALAGVDVSSVVTWDPGAASWFLDPRTMTLESWRDLALLRYGLWPFEIIGLYVWLVLAAGPCMIALRAYGWCAVLGASWIVYIWYQIAPRQLTASEFEVVFPLLAWQLLFVHGIAIGYYRASLDRLLTRSPKRVTIAIGAASIVFMAIALSNPSVTGPSWLRWNVVPPQQFLSIYERYFSLSDLGMGRLLNLAVALPFAYAMLTYGWVIAGRLQALFVTLGRGSLGAFVLHVYGLLILSYVPDTGQVWSNALMQVLLIVAIATLLTGMRRLRTSRPAVAPSQVMAHWTSEAIPRSAV